MHLKFVFVFFFPERGGQGYHSFPFILKNSAVGCMNMSLVFRKACLRDTTEISPNKIKTAILEHMERNRVRITYNAQRIVHASCMYSRCREDGI